MGKLAMESLFKNPISSVEGKIKEKSPKNITIEKLRRILAEKAREGNHDQVRELIISFSGDRLSDLEHSAYLELLKRAEMI